MFGNAIKFNLENHKRIIKGAPLICVVVDNKPILIGAAIYTSFSKLPEPVHIGPKASRMDSTIYGKIKNFSRF